MPFVELLNSHERDNDPIEEVHRTTDRVRLRLILQEEVCRKKRNVFNLYEREEGPNKLFNGFPPIFRDPPPDQQADQ